MSSVCLLFIYCLCWVFVAEWLFSSCGEQGLLSSCGAQASHCGGFSCEARAPGCSAFSSCSSQAPEHWLSSVARVLICSVTGVRSPQIRDWTRVSCIGRQMLYLCVTREAPQCVLTSYLSLTAFLEYFCEQLREIIFPIFQTLNSLLLPAQMMYSTLRLSVSPVFIFNYFFTGI